MVQSMKKGTLKHFERRCGLGILHYFSDSLRELNAMLVEKNKKMCISYCFSFVLILLKVMLSSKFHIDVYAILCNLYLN